MNERQSEIIVVGAGAAGLMAALAARGAVDDHGRSQTPAADGPSVIALDASSKLGLKILVSGGGRCNVANERADERDFETDTPHLLRGYLAGFDVQAVQTYFESRGCPLYAEPLGKLFPRSDDAADVLGTLLNACRDAGVDIRTGADVTEITAHDAGWRVATAEGPTFQTSRVIVATGGKSLPKTGSRGFGFELARRVGHKIVPPLPALTPLLFDEESPFSDLAGVTHPVILTLVPRTITIEQAAGKKFRPMARAAGSCLFTHQGASGPAALDVSGVAGRALHEKQDVVLRADVWSLTHPSGAFAPFLELPKPPGASLAAADVPRTPTFEEFIADARKEAFAGYRQLGNVIAQRAPKSLVDALLTEAGVDPERPAKSATLHDWRRTHAALTFCDVRFVGTDGYEKAEVTSGGVPLSELRRGTLESRHARGLFFCGEVVNVTGRLGGFNFQWAWSSGFAAGRGAAQPSPPV